MGRVECICAFEFCGSELDQLQAGYLDEMEYNKLLIYGEYNNGEHLITYIRAPARSSRSGGGVREAFARDEQPLVAGWQSWPKGGAIGREARKFHSLLLILGLPLTWLGTMKCSSTLFRLSVLESSRSRYSSVMSPIVVVNWIVEVEEGWALICAVGG